MSIVVAVAFTDDEKYAINMGTEAAQCDERLTHGIAPNYIQISHTFLIQLLVLCFEFRIILPFLFFLRCVYISLSSTCSTFIVL